MLFAVYVAIFLIGVVLGLLGGGGTMLAVPVMVYLLGMDMIQATSYSLALVGITAWAGTFQYALKKQVEFKAAWFFAVPSVLTVMFVRAIIVPHLPQIFFRIQNIDIPRDFFLMSLFAMLMLMAGYSMITSKNNTLDDKESVKLPDFRAIIVVAGTGEGFITGLVGAGGGFLIIPALIYLANIPMRLAIGTSLFIIALKSTLGFAADIWRNSEVDYTFLLLAGSITILGSIFGSKISSRLPTMKLKVGFGWFTVVIGTIILINEIVQF